MASKKRWGIPGAVAFLVLGGTVTADRLQPDRSVSDNLFTSIDANSSFAGGVTQDLPAIKTNLVDPALASFRQVAPGFLSGPTVPADPSAASGGVRAGSGQ